MSTDIFLGRQAILDGERCTFGYELLYRGGPADVSSFDDSRQATRGVIERVLLHWGMERIIGDRFGFINADAEVIRSGIHLALPPEGIIFELREDEPYDDEIVEKLVEARRQGYHFALDNVRDVAHLEASQALPFVSMVKVELTTVPRAEIRRLVEEVRRRVPTALLVAEKVETAADFGLCVEAGFDLFQGYFFARPEVLSKADRPTNASSAVALLAEIQRAELDVDRVEELVGADPSLGFRLLAVVNSSAFGLDRRVDSIRHAIVLLGLNQVRHLATLLSLSASKDANEELITLGAVRAKLASSLVSDPTLRSSAFTVGLLSVTDAIYRTPMADLLAELPVTDEISGALVDGTGELGRILEIARACERADVAAICEIAPDQLDAVHGHYADAIAWADELRDHLVMRRSRVELPGTPWAPPIVHA